MNFVSNVKGLTKCVFISRLGLSPLKISCSFLDTYHKEYDLTITYTQPLPVVYPKLLK